MGNPSLETTPAEPTESQATLPPPTVRPFTPAIAEQWDRFVFMQPGGSFFHLVTWKRVIEKTFGYESCYFLAERSGRITGVAPLFSISNWIAGQCLLSVPFGVYGGVCAEDTESELALLHHLKQFALSRNVDFLELRNRNRGLLPDFHPNRRYATFTAPLSEDLEVNWKRLPKDTRYMIRKGEKAGLRARQGLNQLEDFYRLFAWNLRHHGTPVFPRALFDNLVEEFPGRVHLLMVYAESRPVTGVLSFYFRDTILPYYAGSTSAANRLAANNFMYWELMKAAAQQGIRCFDFGRSKMGTGAYAFKTQWNMNVELLEYQVYLVRRKTAPNISPVNPKFKLAARIWQRMPMSLTTWLGPRVVRWFP